MPGHCFTPRFKRVVLDQVSQPARTPSQGLARDPRVRGPFALELFRAPRPRGTFAGPRPPPGVCPQTPSLSPTGHSRTSSSPDGLPAVSHSTGPPG